ncbi:CotH kinase family protein [Salinibacterium sp. G-O1]|uniref:CotH kinase family protein n=1 Tax=Salinibacterium sp. G-O1 TaxID=3046208 RepID=UPI0024B9CDF3|nr:CotH kinase family protein [Salinibacterium sp. G-O1]MDJ0336101.1 CotH kinase family protein [Salinibacterium sp. G-O1]
MITPSRTVTRSVAAFVGIGLVAASLTACSVSTTATTDTSIAPTGVTAALWDSSAVHSIELVVDPAELQGLIDTYLATGDKEWVSATVVIDGQTFTDVGLKLKGNSSLRVVTADSDPASLPWVIRLDKFVDGQSLDGETELVVRGSSTETAINEAVALEMLALAGLASEEAVSSRFSINGGTTELRLVIQNPNDGWDEQEFGATGLLYKAESGGDYTYRGDDPESYTDIFDQEAGDDNLEPLITFLQFINESDDATFAADLDQYLDVDAFATYLAYQDLVDNFDDIDGAGNNSYLHYDETTGIMTVVNWDLNLAFGTANVDGGGGAPGANGGQPGQGAVQGQGGPPAGDAPAGGGQVGGQAGGGPSNGNVLSERFLENSDFAALVTAAKTELIATLYSSGAAEQAVTEWVTVFTTQADDLVPTATVDLEADAVRESFAQYLSS